MFFFYFTNSLSKSIHILHKIKKKNLHIPFLMSVFSFSLKRFGMVKTVGIQINNLWDVGNERTLKLLLEKLELEYIKCIPYLQFGKYGEKKMKSSLKIGKILILW